MKQAPLAAAVLLAIPALAQNGESEDLQAINVKSSGDDTRTEDTRSYTSPPDRLLLSLNTLPHRPRAAGNTAIRQRRHQNAA